MYYLQAMVKVLENFDKKGSRKDTEFRITQYLRGHSWTPKIASFLAIPDHVYLVREIPPEMQALIDALSSLTSSKMTFIPLTKQDAVCSHTILQALGCELHKIPHSGYEHFVLVDSLLKGPLLPKFWDSTGFNFWTEAYISRLTSATRLVGATVGCNPHNLDAAPHITQAPIAFDNYILNILQTRGLDLNLEGVSEIVLAAGYNFEGLSGQPVGIDWKDIKICHQLDPNPCPWQDYALRYPQLAHLPYEEASKHFLEHKPPEGVGSCANKCDYKAYRIRYPDLDKMNKKQLQAHWVTSGSFQGRDCRGDDAVLDHMESPFYEPHAHETLFLPTEPSSFEYTAGADSVADVLPQGNFPINKKLSNSEAAGLYSDWTLKIIESSANMTYTLRPYYDRILVVFAYYEKDQISRDNFKFFLDTAVVPDAELGSKSHVDYVVVVNGKSTVELPKFDNLQVIERDNTCFDFGSWGIGLAQRTSHHKLFYVLNSSVKGPFKPNYFTGHWTELMQSRLIGNVHLVGLTVNCPDGIGRAIPHVMSMAMVFTTTTLDLGLKAGIFECAKTYEDAMRREGDFSLAVLNAGYNIDAMQADNAGVDWVQYLVINAEQTKNGASPSADGYSRCANIPLDIFYVEGWYHGLSPHPNELVFHKTNRHINVELVSKLSKQQLLSRRGGK
jgi:hypothetical protein